MKLGFSKRKNGVPKEDITRDRDPNTKGMLCGLALAAVLMAGLAAASLKVAKVFGKKN